jgi:hypothetical protein
MSNSAFSKGQIGTPVAVSNGGTGATTLTGVLVGTGTSAVTTKTNPSGAFVGDTDTQTVSNKTYTRPKIVDTGSIDDENGNEQIKFSTTASAVNEVSVKNAATGNAPQLQATGGDTNIDLKLVAKGTGKVNIDASYGAITTDTDGATVTFNLATSNVHTVVLGGNRTLALSNASVGQKFMLILVQDGTGTRTVTWFSTIKWPGGVTPTLTPGANKADLFGFTCTSSGQYYGLILGQNL